MTAPACECWALPHEPHAGFCPARTERDGRLEFQALLDRSSIGAGLRDIKERGIDAHLADLEREMRPKRKR